MNCGSNTASVSWSGGNGALSFTMTMECSNGQTYICSTNETECDITNMACGQTCTVKVVAEGHSCNSSEGTGSPVITGPCVPQNVSASVSCSSNIATVTWGSSQGAELYTVTASSVNDLSANCTSPSTSCDLSALTCGQSYIITVKAKGSNCSSGNSAPVQVQAVPCTPSNVLPTVDCVTKALVVSWTPSAGGQYYTATLQDSNGQSTSCQSTDSQCNVTGLSCGQLYRVNVTASDSLCSSPPSATVSTNSVPCAASSIRAVLDCQLGTATVSWQYGAGAQGYAVSALAPVNTRTSCTSNSSITHCELSDLQCGNEYTVNVQSLGYTCNASAQMTGLLITGPCVPQHLTVHYSPSTALLSWDVTKGGSNFTAEAVTLEGLTVTCETSNTNCTFPHLDCDQIYNISVTAHNSVCSDTVTSDPIKTEPCPPQNVKASLNCATLSATVSWEPSQLAVGYVAFLEGGNDHSTSCQTNHTYCSVPYLTCGTVYYVRVRAIGEVFNSSDSTGVNMTSAPCLSTSVSAMVDCTTDSVLVSWSAIAGAENYSVTALGSEGQTVSCSTNQNHCNISSLQCGQQFNLTFSSTNQQCQTTSTTNVTFLSRPCVPLQPVINTLCGNKMSVMSWDVREVVDYYIAQAFSAAGEYQLCNSTSSVCSFSTLGFGETFTFSVTAHRGHCQSDTSAPVYLTTDPCKPENVTAHVSCDSETVELDWSKAKGASFYIVMATGSLGYFVDFNTSSTNLSVSLLCGQSYNVSVQANSDTCDSLPSIPALFKLAPCTPLNLVTYFECDNQLGSVSWGTSDGANMYTATAVGEDGNTHLCVTNWTSCTWEDLHCGEIYNVTVTANDSRCTSARSNSTTIHMAPCVPQALTPILDCGTGVGSLSWASSAGAETYEVVAVNEDGNTLAFSTNITSGFFSELLCGKQYQVTVRAINGQCRSEPSSPAYLSSVPCVPQNVVSELDCTFNFINIRWNISRGAASYLVVVKGPEGPVTACNTTAQVCRLQTLHCGSSYDVSVIAVNQQCNTSGSSFLQINTVPCVPTHVQSSVNCTTGDVSVSWDPSLGAISYAAVAQTSGGYASVCNSTGTACVFSDLLCGMNYSLTVSATDGTCNTAPSQPVVLSTVPCKPQNASAQLDCDTNSAVVSWELSDTVTHYTVQAIGSDGHRIDCTSSDHSCTLNGMHCGQNYNITVAALDGVCDNSNTHLVLKSAPCAPSNVQTSLHCDLRGGVVSVSWVQANGAESYMAVAVSNDGHFYSCNTTTASCDLQELQCGQIYNVSVYSLAYGCGGVKSTMSQVQTAPCPPQNVSAIVQCDSGSVLVSWNPAVDASLIIVELESESTGVISSCNSTNTQCSITHLPCGERFNLIVVSLRGGCQSQPSSNLSITSAPCIPQGVNGTVDCVTNSAWVSWEVANGAESYTVLAVGEDGNNSTCSSSNSTCNAPDLGCGRSYTFYVTASNAACLSPPSSSFQLETAPCALSSIVVVAECHSSVIMVQWQKARSGNSLYFATAEDQDLSILSCNSSTSSCNLTNVQCDKEYTIIVAASANKCSSLRSPPYKIRTAPCQPSSVQADTDCQSNNVFVSWNPSYVAQSYLLTAVGRDGDLKTCKTSDINCTLTDLQCSNIYQVSILASNENCTSLPSDNITIKTMPCDPANLTVTLQCGNSSSASLSWVGSTGSVAYMGLAQSENGTTTYCETTKTSCILEGLVCGTVYNFTVQAMDGFCNNSLSETQTKGAAPCPPTGFRVIPRTVVNDTQILRASWSAVNCPNSEYLLALTGSIQGTDQALFDITSYWTSRTVFEVPLPCASTYSATISARNSATTSGKSAAVTGTTVPCAPLNVTFSASLAVVAWNESLFAENYTVYGVTSSGRMKLCTTSQLLCSVTNFSSGHIVVTAQNAAGESGDSVPVVAVTADRRR
ncbi:fibronectin [Carassius auratus]|uniref:Fibronectin n=1 Tax=Carassius auratus TaxID=7957 RepID=A0A6P6JNW3_CARAU|nr:fibronectin-like [Carassius auratus]